MFKKILVITFIFSAVAAAEEVLHVDAAGTKLKEYYLSLNVEHLWIAGHHINWETGEPDNPEATHNVKTHCSLFAAAACKRLGIYILRPPEHKQGLLANDQFDWLSTKAGTEDGWMRIAGDDRYRQAQQYANQGFVVVVICQNPDPHRPGHTALVMPSEISMETLAESGPKLIMAGTENYNSVSLKTGFKHHLNGWPENVIRFYYNQKKAF